MALFDYRARMLPFVFTAPSGATFRIQYDKLEREVNKKAAVNEVLDSDISILQDQGNSAERIPVEGYITGDNYDLIADGLYTALSERYTTFNSGLLIHPRWGPIHVFPIKWKQSESFVSGQRRANFSIEFVRVYPFGGLFQTIGLVVSQVLGLVDALGSLDVGGFLKDSALAVQAISSTVTSSLSTVKNAVIDLINIHPDIRDLANNIYLEAVNLLTDPGGNAELLIGQMQMLLKLPMNFDDDSLAKINAYSDIVDQLIVDNYNGGDVSASVRKNKAITLQLIGGYAVAAQCAGALSTEFKTRSAAITAIETLENTYNNFSTALAASAVEDTLENSFSGDFEYLDTINDIYTKSASIILKDSFSLSSEKTIVLSEKSDPVTLCYENYGKVDDETMQLFFETNSIKKSEFVELDAGREVVFYV